MKVLIVDDSPVVRDRLVSALAERGGAEVVGCAENVATAQAALGSLSPDAVVLDIRMPDGSGIDLLRTIKKEQPDLRVVMFTYYAGAPYRQRCLSLGADFFFDKATDIDDVVDAVSSNP